MLVCVWRLVDLVAEGRIFDRRAFAWVDTVIVALWAAVGLIISESNKNKKKRQAAEVARNPGYGYDYRREDYGTGFRRPEEWQPGHHNRRAIVPAQCVFSIRGSHGPRDVVSSRCLSEYGLDRRLPRDCAFEIDTGWGSRTVYGARCLRQNGFRISELR